jgi:hypothetical protein
VTYRRGLQLLTLFSDESGLALHVIGMLLTVEAYAVSARSVIFLLMRIGIAEVIRVLSSPLLIRFLLLLTTTLGPTTGLLPLLEPRVGGIPRRVLRCGRLSASQVRDASSGAERRPTCFDNRGRVWLLSPFVVPSSGGQFASASSSFGLLKCSEFSSRRSKISQALHTITRIQYRVGSRGLDERSSPCSVCVGSPSGV